MAAGVSQLEVDGRVVTVERKPIKRLYLRIQPDGAVRLSAPRHIRDADLIQFLRSKQSWLEQHRTAPAYQPRFVEGERFPLWGAYLPLALAEGAAQASAQGGWLRLCLPCGSGPEAAQAALDAWYRRELQRVLPQVAAEREQATGLRAAWQIRDMTSRWGSCTIHTKAIRVNLQLAKYPPACLRYIATHELAHLLVPNHSARFYDRMDGFLPDWRLWKARLQEGAPVLPPLA